MRVCRGKCTAQWFDWLSTGASSASSFGTSLPSPGSAASSFGSYSKQRRFRRSVDTSFEHNFQKRQSDDSLVVSEALHSTTVVDLCA